MMNIRAASDHDAEVLPDIERSAGTIFRKWAGLEWIADDDVQSPDQHRHLIAHGISLVAENDVAEDDIAEDDRQRVVGFLNGELASDALHVFQIAVHYDHQRRGIGRRLLDVAEQIAVTHGVTALTLTTFRDVPWNEPCYHKLGFQTLQKDELNSRLQGILETERQAGLPMEQRCVMVKQIQE